MAAGAIPREVAGEGRSCCIPLAHPLLLACGSLEGSGLTVAALQHLRRQPGLPVLSLTGTVMGEVVFAATEPSGLPRLSGEGQCVPSHLASLGGDLIAHHNSLLGKLQVYSTLSSSASTPKKQAAP